MNTTQQELNFYDTIHLNNKELLQAIRQTENQDKIVLQIFQVNRDISFTPFQILEAYLKVKPSNTPITSIRRSINTLTKQNYLIKLQQTKQEIYGKPNYLWTLNTNNQ
jgi:hypothetical protein